jgi:acyl transferase domain-containing protein
MGRELVRTNPLFRESIKALDVHLSEGLGDAAPSWKIEQELTKPARTSRVDDAAFSQPLCTAIQIALVDTYAAIGITPTAVVGHSSGEVAAAYAAGALTARDAICVAFNRGAIAKQQNKRGGMAAVGLSWEEAEKYLVPGTSVACDNSHDSVTLSGDAEQLQDVVSAIKEEKPTVPATVLKVEKAYHSHHMAEVGNNYYEAMKLCGVSNSNCPLSLCYRLPAMPRKRCRLS